MIIYSLIFLNVAVGYILVVLAAYLPAINVSSSAVGLLMGLWGIVASIGAIPLGILSDRKGRRVILLLSSFVVAPAVIVFALTTNILYLSISVMIFGLGEAGTLATWNAIIADQTKLENRDAAFSLSFVVTTGSIAFGSLLPFFFPAVQKLTGLGSVAVHRDFLILVGVVALASPAWLRFLLRDYAETPTERKITRGKNFPLLLKFSGINSLIGLGAGFIIPLVPTWLFLKFGTLDTYSGPLLAVSNITIALAAVVSPRLSTKYGLVRAIVLAQGFSTIFMLSLAFIPSAPIAAGLYIIRAALMNMSAPLSDSYLMGIMSAEERGLASSVNSVLWRLPNSATTIVGGIILQMGRYDIPFYLATGFYVASIVLFYARFRNISPEK
jgi:MFS family permease